MKSYLQLTRHKGNGSLYLGVEMSLISILRGQPLHIHVEGLRGTGKTTIMRSIKQLLPTITRIKGCLYNCDPKQPHCPLHRHLSQAEITDIGTEEITVPFLEISHSAKIGTVAGSIDLSRLTNPSHPEAALLPGIIPQAHRGIIFIDEINRLADTSPEITDVLLDVMGTKPGRVQIEETGLSIVEVPVSVSVWAASNPDEEPGPLAEIRRQLSDRFDLVIPMGRPSTTEEVMEILNVNQSEHNDQPELTPSEARRMVKARQNLLEIASQGECQIPDYLTKFLANLYINYNIESLRALDAISQAAQLHCALRKRNQFLFSDIMAVLPFTLYHRVPPATLAKIMDTVNSRMVTNDHDNSLDERAEKASGEYEGISENGNQAAPPHKARQLRDLFGLGLIKKETDL